MTLDFGGMHPGEEGGGGEESYTEEDATEPTLEIDLDEIENQSPEKQLAASGRQSSDKQIRNQSSQILCKWGNKSARRVLKKKDG
jgi:hypothetical protein